MHPEALRKQAADPAQSTAQELTEIMEKPMTLMLKGNTQTQPKRRLFGKVKDIDKSLANLTKRGRENKN